MKARSRLKNTKMRRIMKRLKVEAQILAVLMLLYIAYQVISTGALHPVKALSEPQTIKVEVPVEVIKEVEVDRRFTTEQQQIMAYIVEVFGKDAGKAITILATCENSKFDPKATNHNNNGTVDRGVFQINSIHGGDEMYDYKTNIDKAYEIYKAWGNKFTAWTCAYKIGEKNYLGQ